MPDFRGCIDGALVLGRPTTGSPKRCGLRIVTQFNLRLKRVIAISRRQKVGDCQGGLMRDALSEYLSIHYKGVGLGMNLCIYSNLHNELMVELTGGNNCSHVMAAYANEWRELVLKAHA